MKICFFEMDNWENEKFQESLSSHEIYFSDEPINGDAKNIEELEGIVVFIHSKIDRDLLDRMPKLKFISTMSTGFDHIDIEECKKRNIVVSNVPSYGEVSVAEHVFALLLTISRRMIESIERTQKREFMPHGLTGFDLHGKTLGVIGVGSIGHNVIRIAKGFSMNVVANTRTPNPDLEKELGFKFVDLDTLLSQSDIISLHIPYSEENHHFLDSDSFSKMKNGVVIINTARGGLIDTAALISAIRNRKVGFAGLDVLEEEPLLLEEIEILSRNYDKERIVHILEDHVLISFPNVIVTPHNAFNSREALNIIYETTLDNIFAFIGNSPKNTV